MIRKKLGAGGFANVFLAHDEHLDRLVALKLPRRDRFENEEERKQFIEEARMAARLQHPGIVRVFDVSETADTVFIVLEYICGRSLADLLRHESVSHEMAAQLIAEISAALWHAHDQGFVHRDIKPQNILLNRDDRPHIADFGLAVRHGEADLKNRHVAGTTHYMAPEQVRGENHRLDRRTDVWALGVILYRMLTGQLPFTGSSAKEVFQKILYSPAAAPTQLAPGVPLELERICLRCLQSQMRERYRTAMELADDLDAWLRFTTGGSSGSGGRHKVMHIEPPDAPVVPRGLRSFGKEDVDFFLKLVPGPRDRDGLPTAIQFWKNRVEERDADETFAIGVLYGPSGCGKSSLVRAGLAPRLSPTVSCVYVQSTSHDTEERLVKALHRRFNGLASEIPLPDAVREARLFPLQHQSVGVSESSLPDAMHAMRKRADLRSNLKLLIVLDQFEQWLHTWNGEAEADLVQALRQCDGAQVQCVLIVRDDFWLPVSRFMRLLEIGIVDGVNGMLVDSFDLEHAKRVLREFGVAYGRLPVKEFDQTPEQTEFVERAVAELAQEGRLYPVRLAVFVEMVKDRPWLPGALDEMGGAEGVGVSFLEQSLGAQAGAARRMHESAARNVLRALLPQTGQLGDTVRTRSQLVEAAGCAQKPGDFDDLMRLLEIELRLLTPARSPDEASSKASDVDSLPAFSGELAYRLTHDFLVPSIREWLERQLRDTPRGRATLLLQEQAKIWNSRPSPRRLPSAAEWMWLCWRTSHKDWSLPQRRMMDAARSRIVRRGLLAAMILLVGLAATMTIGRNLQRQRDRSEAQRLISKLQDVDIHDVPDVLAELEPYRRWTAAPLRRVFADRSQSQRRRVRAAAALLPSRDAAAWLTDQLVDEQTPPKGFLVIRSLLRPHAPQVAKDLHAKLDDDLLLPRARFRAACALAGFDHRAAVWSDMADEVVGTLLREPAAYATVWIEALTPASEALRAPLFDAAGKAATPDAAHVAALALFEFDQETTGGLVDLLAVADGPVYRAVTDLLRRKKEISLPLVRQRLKQGNVDSVGAKGDVSEDLPPKQKARLILAIFELGDATPLQQGAVRRADPRLRTQLIHGMGSDQMDLTLLLPLLLNAPKGQPLHNVVMLAASSHLDKPLSQPLRERLAARLIDVCQSAADGEARSVSELLLRKLNVDVTKMNEPHRGKPPTSSREWFINAQGQPMILIDPPNDPQAEASGGSTFAISTTEVTVGQFRSFMKTFDPDHHPHLPAIGVLDHFIAGYCNWLSDRDSIPESEWCYPAFATLSPSDCAPLPGFLDKIGYRLPTEFEWEVATRAGSRTSRFYGESTDLLPFYAWSSDSCDKLQPVAQLLPNPYGLFDVYGSVAELCYSDVRIVDGKVSVTFRRRGQSYFNPAERLHSEAATSYVSGVRSSSLGFRVVRRIVKKQENMGRLRIGSN